MDESSSDKNTSTKVLAEEEDLRWDLHPSDLLCDDWKTATTNRGEEDDEHCGHMQRKVVLGAILVTPTHWLLHSGHDEVI
jgi:hypothetical protein